MISNLAKKEILLGVCGGIACYKAVEVLRGLKREQAEVSVVMTQGACEFVTPLTFQTLSNRPVMQHVFSLEQESHIGHIHLAERADLALIAPCTANMLARLRAGLADDPVSTVMLACKAPIYLALAMNDNMLANSATQENLAVLGQRGFRIIQPQHGFLAEGKLGLGRLAEPLHIVQTLLKGSANPQNTVQHTADSLAAKLTPWQGKRVLVTAGPTQEALDPVRFLSNHSSGKMGFALVLALLAANAQVTLVCGPTCQSLPVGGNLKTHCVGSAQEMYTAVMAEQHKMDAFIFAAAVADYRPKEASLQKQKREGQPTLTLQLVQNFDIAALVGKQKTPQQRSVVFAAETHNLLKNARLKLQRKHADLVVANVVGAGQGFHAEDNQASLIQANAAPVHLQKMPKSELALHILAHAAALF